ncbi:MAG: DMT family transporter [Alphaproteobacteria bacterium]|nr:DMT family transporter [Alphaproteobacteria bacterium]
MTDHATQNDPPRWLAAAPIFFVLLWATGFVGAGLSMPHSEPFTFLTARFAAVIPLMAALAVVLRAPWPARADALNAIFVGAVIHGVYLGAVFWVVDRGMPTGVSALIVGLQPLITAVLAGWILGDDVRPRHWFALALGLGGVVLVVWPKLNLSGSGINPVTIAAGFVGVTAISLGTVYQKRFVTGVNLVTGAVWQYVGATLAVGLAALMLEDGIIIWNRDVVIAFLWLTLVLSVGAVSLYMVMIRHGQVSKVSTVFYLVPAIAALIAWFMFGETLTLLQIGGMAVCALAVAIATRPDPFAS